MTVNETVLFQRHSVDEHADTLADYLPPGIMFEGGKIDNTNLRKLLRGLAQELFKSEDLLKQWTEEYYPDCTTLYLDEWEKTLGIPDDCFSGTGTQEERRRDILVKLASLGIQTEQDFEDLAALFGVTVEIEQGADFGGAGNTFPLQFPVSLLFSSPKEARFTIIVRFTVPDTSRFTLFFPIVFGGNEIAILECLFNKLKPANCNVIFLQV